MSPLCLFIINCSSFNIFQIENISNNKALVKQYDLEDLIQKIKSVSLGDVNIASYSQHYPSSPQMVQTIKTVQRWPKMTDGYHNPFIISLLSLILSLNININNQNMFTSVKLIEKVQLQYALLLQRYLKSVEIKGGIDKFRKYK